MPSSTPPSPVNPNVGDLADLDIRQGQAIHRGIGALLANNRAGTPVLSLSDIAHAARLGCGTTPLDTPTEKAFRQAVTTGIGVYARWFLLGPAWNFVGSEVRAPGCRFDLVWVHDDGRILIDEIKRGSSRNTHPEATRQVKRYLTTARTEFGASFIGVRLLWVSSPLGSQFFAASGRRAVRLSTVPELIGGRL